jgi:hypothetical protein
MNNRNYDEYLVASNNFWIIAFFIKKNFYHRTFQEFF